MEDVFHLLASIKQGDGNVSFGHGWCCVAVGSVNCLATADEPLTGGE
jgi:hypothetical protein